MSLVMLNSGRSKSEDTALRFLQMLSPNFLVEGKSSLLIVLLLWTLLQKRLLVRRPKFGLPRELPSSDLTAKYSVLYRIGIANWPPSSHGSSIKAELACLIYKIGTRSSFDFGEFVFDHLEKHAKSFAVKLRIGFPSIITGILLKQNKNILHRTDVAGKRLGVLNVSHKLFEGKHVRDLVRPSIASGSTMKMGLVSDEVQRNILKELCEEIDILKNTIETFSHRKSICNGLMQSMTSSTSKDGASSSQPGQDGDAESTGVDEDSEGSGNSGSDDFDSESDDDTSHAVDH